MKFPVYLLAILILSACTGGEFNHTPGGIDISRIHPQYWEYNGEPVMLLGGSDEDNLFQLQALEEQLDLLASAGGNYVRNTMSSRDSGNVWAFQMDQKTGKYDLRVWNPEYWKRFQKLLELTDERGIIVQVELWATFDFYRDNWDRNPFNPLNNVNYTTERTKLPVEVKTHPTMCENPFFWSVPSHQNNMPLLEYQQRFVDKLLSYSLEFDNILYCIDNETSVTSQWGKFWAEYIKKIATEQGRKIHVTEMWDPWDLDHISHRESFDYPETYSFVDISQNNHQRGENQWTNGLRQILRLEKNGCLRPVNNVKTYGNEMGRHGGGTHNGIQSFIRNTLFGSAAVRFHRPPSGLGLGDTAQAVIRGMRMATDRIDFFKAVPNNDLLGQREENEAYCRAVPGQDYLVYFPDQGEVKLDLGGSGKGMQVDRLEILNGEWTHVDTEVSDASMMLQSKGNHTIFIIQQNQP